MKKNLSKLAFIISLAASGQSFAALEIYSSSLDRANQNASYSFTQTGVSGEDAAIVRGFGKDMPLGLSLQIIVPKTWQVNLNDGAEDLLVDWEGKSSWPYVLENLAKQNKLKINIDWTSKVVDVYSLDASKKHELATYEEDMDQARASIVRKHSKYRDHMQEEVAGKYGKDGDASIEEIYNRANVKPVDGKIRTFVNNVYNGKVTAESNAKFILKKDSMLSENVKMWGDYTNWDVKWSSNTDYKIQNEVVFEGNLKQSVEKALKLYSDSEKPLKAEFFDGNRVIDVKDFIFKDPKLNTSLTE
jgi:hypothetical protein